MNRLQRYIQRLRAKGATDAQLKELLDRYIKRRSDVQ